MCRRGYYGSSEKVWGKWYHYIKMSSKYVKNKCSIHFWWRFCKQNRGTINCKIFAKSIKYQFLILNNHKSYRDSPSSCSLIVWRSFKCWLVVAFPVKWFNGDPIPAVGDCPITWFLFAPPRLVRDSTSVYKDLISLLLIRLSPLFGGGDKFGNGEVEEGAVGGHTPSRYTILESPLIKNNNNT